LFSATNPLTCAQISSFLTKAKDGDYHQEMNGPIFLNWFENQLMPALKSPSVIVLDNASYHNIKTEETVVPNFNQRKAVLQDYLSKHNIPFQPLETKKQLYEKIKFKKLLSVFKTDKIANLHGHASSLACSFNQIIWGIKWYSPGLHKLKKLE
jgi:hypothetical protein